MPILLFLFLNYLYCKMIIVENQLPGHRSVCWLAESRSPMSLMDESQE